MKKIALVLLVFLCAGFYAAAADWDTGFSTASAAGINLSWKTDSQFIYVKLSAPTTGWVAVGFGATFGMKDADIIMGYVSGKDVVVEDQFGSGAIAHKLDTELGGKDSIIEKSGSIVKGVTELRFKLALNSGDSYDQVFKAGETSNVILAYRNDTKMTGKHTVRAKLQITF